MSKMVSIFILFKRKLHVKAGLFRFSLDLHGFFLNLYGVEIANLFEMIVNLIEDNKDEIL